MNPRQDPRKLNKNAYTNDHTTQTKNGFVIYALIKLIFKKPSRQFGKLSSLIRENSTSVLRTLFERYGIKVTSCKPVTSKKATESLMKLRETKISSDFSDESVFSIEATKELYFCFHLCCSLFCEWNLRKIRGHLSTKVACTTGA